MMDVALARFVLLSISFCFLQTVVAHGNIHPRTALSFDRFAGQQASWNQSDGNFATGMPTAHPPGSPYGIFATELRMQTIQCGTKTSTFSSDPLSGYNDVCILWNKSCTGDEKQASSKFNDWYERVFKHPCWGNPWCECKVNGQKVSQASSSALADLLSFARSRTCGKLRGVISAYDQDVPVTGCCGACDFVGGIAVDLYYWPKSNANKSCLSIIGEGTVPNTEDATTRFLTSSPGSQVYSEVYWGCEATSNKLKKFKGLSYVTTATMSTADTLTMKLPLYNPWSLPFTCVGTSEPSSANISSQLNVHNKVVRSFSAFPLTESKTEIYNDTGPQVVTRDGFTLYARLFSNIHTAH